MEKPKRKKAKKEDARATAEAKPAREYKSAEEVQHAVDEMRAFFKTGTTLPLHYRRAVLEKLRTYLKKHEEEALDALRADLGKAPFEGYATELGVVYEEIRLCLSKMYGWAKPKHVPTPLAHFPSSSKVYAAPFGVAAVLLPWNYPLQLALVPLVDALAAGNCVVLKPSRTAKATSAFLQRLCEEAFDERLVRYLPGSAEMNAWILEVNFDKVFFTGSPAVGRQIMHAAAENLTDVTLELGGKSPCIIAADAQHQARRAAHCLGQMSQFGQPALLPTISWFTKALPIPLPKSLPPISLNYYGKRILECDYYPHMINEHHFNRVCGLIDNHGPKTRIAFGGGRNRATLRIEPTILTGVSLDDPVMQERYSVPSSLSLPGKSLMRYTSTLKTSGTPWLATSSPKARCYRSSLSKPFPSAVPPSTMWLSTWQTTTWVSAALGKAA